MKEQEQTREQLIAELVVLRKQVKELKEIEAKHDKAEQALRESEERYRLLFDLVPVGISITTMQGNILATNKAMQELWGYTLEEQKTVNISTLYFDPAERQRLLDMLQESGKVRNFETKYKHKDGTAWTVLMNSDLIGLGDQRVLLTSMRDITDQRKAEEALKKERDFINAVLDTAGALVMVLDREGRVTRSNRACEIVTGYTFQEVRGKHFWDILTTDAALTKARAEKLLAGYYPSTYDSIWITKTGEQRLVSWSNTVLLDEEHSVEYIIATGNDITERRKTEIELQEANQKLSTWVKELEEQSREMTHLSEMGEMFQSCQNLEEAYAIGAQYIQKLFPDYTGALCLINSSKDLVEAIEMWGDPAPTKKVFEPMDCWALRRGRLYLIDDHHPGLLCAHITQSQTAKYLCVPLLAQGEALGILHLQCSLQDQPTIECFDGHKQQLAESVAEHLALALANLKLREKLRQQAIRDILTGIFNRRYLEETLERELRRAERNKSPVGVIMLDIDHFKEFNDLFGHAGGDALLHELGGMLKKSTRGADIVSRYGGGRVCSRAPGYHSGNHQEAGRRTAPGSERASGILPG
jgi:PAS domain S-box-containing protein